MRRAGLSSRASDPLKVLQINSGDAGGGAERVGIALHEGLKRRGHRAWLAVGVRRREDADILPILPGGRGPLGRLARAVHPWVGRVRGAGRVHRVLRLVESPALLRSWWRGRESFDYPGTAFVLDLPPEAPDVIHAHNLHGDYFDLRRLPEFSARVPVAMTLHDEWAYTGHCAYTMGLETWRSGCVSCPDLEVYPAIRRDATHQNWLAKASIYTESRLYISAPTRWLLERAQESILARGTAAWRVIPNGVDLDLFRPGDRDVARRQLGLPEDAAILLFAANRARRSPFKDHDTVVAALRRVSSLHLARRVLLIVLGDSGPGESLANGEVRYVPYERDAARLVAHYRAADLYLHAAKAEAAGLTILEALATGTPVVASGVGGIPEEVRSLQGAPGSWDGETHAVAQATGILVPPADPDAMAAATAHLLSNDDLRRQLSANALADARDRFDLDDQVDATIAWYRDIRADWEGWVGGGRSKAGPTGAEEPRSAPWR